MVPIMPRLSHSPTRHAYYISTPITPRLSCHTWPISYATPIMSRLLRDALLRDVYYARTPIMRRLLRDAYHATPIMPRLPRSPITPRLSRNAKRAYHATPNAPIIA
jgi:hypothetical protein